MSSSDKTKEVLEQILAQLYAEQAVNSKASNNSYLIAEDGQLLGNITTNPYDANSLLNEYGPFGSQYSGTSIFNPYSPYGSQYGAYSINNPYCTQAPKLIINGTLIGRVTANQYAPNRISPEAFLYTLKNNLPGLLNGQIIESESHARKLKKESYIESYDGNFLGKLNPNIYDQKSIFNQYGIYGNKFSQESLFNAFSKYGNQFSNLSPYNKFTKTPPKIFLNGEFVAYLTANEYIQPRIHPDDLLSWAERNVPKEF